MTRTLHELVERIGEAVAAAPIIALAGVFVVVGLGVAAGGFFAYQTYDYVQHDNDFCLTCHLMQDPYERFARSAHRDMGCKACHQPTFVARSQMALTQIIENPEELTAHADVPNRVCADCHVEGDPEEWTLIANSAGHKVHLESSDSTLQGLQCVQCHSTSLHEFAATDRTCGQSGCHSDIKVQLGRMADFTIHCAACHAFSTPVPESASAEAVLTALRPERSECLTCHAMRQIVEMPPDDPHNGACGACHNPHTQSTPAEAAEGCTAGGCHTDPMAASPFHRGIPEEVVVDCMQCHEAHDFSVDGQNCINCHQEVFRDRNRTALRPSGDPFRGPGLLHAPGVGWNHPPVPDGPGANDAAWLRAGLAGPVQVPPEAGRQNVQFRHADHRAVACLNCHSTDESHGQVTVTGLSGCRNCHHAPDQRASCRACHAPGGFTAEPRMLERTLHMSVMDHPVERDLPFEHESHESLQCGACHTDPPALSAEGLNCDSCHEEHHDIERATCYTCHEAEAGGSHTLEVHATCSGAGCHENTPFSATGVPASRRACLTCHEELVDHRAPRNCVECHAIPGSGGNG